MLVDVVDIRELIHEPVPEVGNVGPRMISILVLVLCGADSPAFSVVRSEEAVRALWNPSEV